MIHPEEGFMSRCDFHKIFPKKRPNFRPLKNLFYHSFFFQKFHSCFFRSFSLYIYLVIHIHHLFCGDSSFHHIHNFLKLRIFFQGFIPGNGHSLIRRKNSISSSSFTRSIFFSMASVSKASITSTFPDVSA